MFDNLPGTQRANTLYSSFVLNTKSFDDLVHFCTMFNEHEAKLLDELICGSLEWQDLFASLSSSRFRPISDAIFPFRGDDYEGKIMQQAHMIMAVWRFIRVGKKRLFLKTNT